jgi:hypothetical protein
MFLQIHNDFTNKDISIQVYTSRKYFPTEYSIAIKVGRNTYYVPLEEYNEYDSSLRAFIEKEYQISKSLPINIVNRYFPGGNLMIPLDNLYETLLGLFGQYLVSKNDDKIIFKAPSRLSGLTKLFICGLNVKVSYDGINYITYYNGLSNKSHEKDRLMSNIMVIKLVPGYTYEISYADTFKTYSYTTELVKNFIIIGYDVEYLPEECSTYAPLYLNNNYHLCRDNKIIRAAKNTEDYKYIQYIKNIILIKII